VQVPEYWRSPTNRLYRIKRERRAQADRREEVFTVRAIPLGGAEQPVEVSRALREADLREMVKLGQQVPTAEQLFEDAFRQVTAQLGRY
jgi:hypothetical protein